MKKTQPKKLTVVNSKTLIATADIGKNFNVGYTRYIGNRNEKPFRFANNKEGFNKFWQALESVKAENSLEDIVVGFESTGAYAEPLQHFLKDKPVLLVQVNPMHTKKVKELNGNSPNKTDYKDPKVIADIIELGHSLSVVIPEGTSAELRRLTQARERAIKRRTALYNQLQELIFVIFPEFPGIFKNVKSKSVQHILLNYPTPQEIVQLGFDAFNEDLKKASKGRLSSVKIKNCFDVAKTSVGIIAGQDSIVFEIQSILEAVLECDKLISKLESKMDDYLEQIPCKKELLSMKGIGRVSVAGLIGEIGDFNNFHTQQELLKFAGLDLFEISSGKHKGNRRISKRGRPLLRKLLFFAALNTVRKGGIMHKHYQRYLQNGMKRIKALVAIARKLLVLIFALVRDHVEYQENYQPNKASKLQEAA